MTPPIEQVSPALPGNTVRRPDVRNKRIVTEADRERRQNQGKDPSKRPGHENRPDGSEHIVDELA
jgi:hypothetical protein